MGGFCFLFVLLVGSTLRAPYSSAQPVLFLRLRTCSAALVAISKTSRTPSLLLAEHSRYPKAQIRPAMSRPSSDLTGSCEVKPQVVSAAPSHDRSRSEPSSRTTRVSMLAQLGTDHTYTLFFACFPNTLITYMFQVNVLAIYSLQCFFLRTWTILLLFLQDGSILNHLAFFSAPRIALRSNGMTMR